MVESCRELIVLRHAKTEHEASSDLARALTDRGKRNARAAGRWLSEHRLGPDSVVASPAARALATAEIVCAQLEGGCGVDVDQDLYGASVDEVVDLATVVDPAVRRLMLVGHNPTMSRLAYELQHEPRSPWNGELPTCGVAVLRFTGEWSGLRLGAADLVDWHVPRG